MTQDTTQFVYRALVLAFIGAFAAIIGALIAAIFVFGDGEAQKIITDMTPIALGAFGAMSLVFLGHQGVTAMQTATAAGLQTAQAHIQQAQAQVQQLQQTQPAQQTLAPVALTLSATAGSAQGH